MKEKKLFDAITEVKDHYIEEAETKKLTKRKINVTKWITVAASLILFIGLTSIFVVYKMSFGGNTGTGNSDGNRGMGHDESSLFMSYAGPVFPISFDEANKDIETKRTIIYDFSCEDENSRRVWGTNINDNYVFSNTLKESNSIHAIYPFLGSYNDLQEQMPVIKVDGQIASMELYVGDSLDYLNFQELKGWEEYKQLLENTNYQESALELFEGLLEPVTVYLLSSDQLAPEEYRAATQSISFTIDPEKTTILEYGFEGGHYGDDGFRRLSYSVPNDLQGQNGLKALVVIGEDIVDYELEGYKNGATEEGNELEGISATVTREESDLVEIVEQLVESFIVKYEDKSFLMDKKDLILTSVLDEIVRAGLLTKTDSNYMREWKLEDLMASTLETKRIFYTIFDVNILAQKQVEVSVQLFKEPSFDDISSSANNEGIQGYDLVTQLGTNIYFSDISAEIVNYDSIEIVRQNMGFDLLNNVTKVALDATLEHYYLEIKLLQN